MKSNFKDLLPMGFDLQLFADGGIDAGEGGGDDPVVETFKFKDPQTHAELELPQKVGDVDLQVMIGHIIGKSNKEAEKKYKGLMKEITDKTDGQFKDLQDQVKEFQLKDMSEQERAETIAAESIDKANKKRDEMEFFAKANWNLYKDTKIDNDLMSALGVHDLYNPRQTKMVLKQMGTADLVPDGEGHKTILKLNIDGDIKEMSPKEAGDYFLAQPENANHLKNNLRSGGGTKTGTSGRVDGDGTIYYTRTAMQSDAVRKEYNEKLMSGEAVQIVDE